MAVSSSLETCGFINSISSSLANVATPQTFKVDAQNDGLEHVSPFKYGHFGVLIKRQILGLVPLFCKGFTQRAACHSP